MALVWGALYLVWRVGWSGAGADPVLFPVLLGAESFAWLSLAMFAFLAWRVPPSVAPAATRSYDVDVFVCTTLLGCRAIRHPHTTWLLDDGRRPEVAALAADLGARYLTRPDNTHAKAGNINHALGHTDGELIVVLDADHVPLPNLLDAVVGYFDDEDVALVQTPHEFFNHDSIQHSRRGARHEQGLFFRVICPGKDRHNGAFWCGSAAVLRRRALEDVGGVRCETIAEDFHTTIAMHQKGWRTRYHDEVLVQGRAPHDLASYLLQRSRWARGNLRVFRTPQNPFTARGLTFRQRLSYLASLSNYASGPQRLVLLVVLAATLLTGRLPMAADSTALLELWAPWTVLSLLATVALGRRELGSNDGNRYGMMTLGIFTVAFASLLRAGAGSFKVTPKQGRDRGGAIVLRQLGLLCAIGSAVGLAAVLRGLALLDVGPLQPMPTTAAVVTLALGAYQVSQIGYLVGHLVLRRQLRGEYRPHMQVAGRIGDSVVRVVDLTPSGLGALMPRAVEPGWHVPVHLALPTLSGGVQHLSVEAEVRSCHDLGAGTWRVGLHLPSLDDEQCNALTEYCYVIAPALEGRRSSQPTADAPLALTEAAS
jgi:cellulose synthase (UDP-forming)